MIYRFWPTAVFRACCLHTICFMVCWQWVSGREGILCVVFIWWVQSTYWSYFYFGWLVLSLVWKWDPKLRGMHVLWRSFNSFIKCTCLIFNQTALDTCSLELTVQTRCLQWSLIKTALSWSSCFKHFLNLLKFGN